jgi:hypothetical protein
MDQPRRAGDEPITRVLIAYADEPSGECAWRQTGWVGV